MIILEGKGVSQGVVKGPLYFYNRQKNDVEMHHADDIEVEKERLAHAQKQAVLQLKELAEQGREESGEDLALLFETHAMLVEDEFFADSILGILEEKKCNAEAAVEEAGAQFAAMFAAMDDEYMQARAADIGDVTRRIVNNLQGVAEGGINCEEPVILASDDLAPSETIQLDKQKILAFVTAEGSENSHTAILARTMGIPAICGLGERLCDLREAYSGKTVYVDGGTGQMILDPDEQTVSGFCETCEKQKEMKQLLTNLKGKEDVTLDGRAIRLYCNIGSAEDMDAVLANDGQGIGLFRTEFLYLSLDRYPTEEEQFQAYKTVAEGMKGKRVIIRTLDIGADKQIGYFDMKKEANPALGIRGIRVCLNRPEVFHTQLRALYRASAYGNVAIMFPMITSVWEVRACKAACEQVMAELEREGIPFRKETGIGIMIETPASVFVADALAKEVDFFSVGTNDLIQYTLACDRQCNDMGKYYDPHHPAVLRALKIAADAAHEAGIWIGICGELAADISLLPTFFAIGIDELSVSPDRVLPLRAEIRKTIAANGTFDILK